MKAIALFVLVVSSMSFGATYKCAEKAAVAIKEGRLQYSVILKELEGIDDPAIVGEHDAAGYMQVSILSRDPELGGSFTSDRPTFKAVATYEDVILDIKAKRQRFDMTIYLDEMDQASMKISGVAKRISLNCSSDRN